MPQDDLSDLSRFTAGQLDRVVIERNSVRAHQYKRFGMACGLICFLSCIGSFTYLVIEGHDTPAYAILGATVLGIIGQMISAKL